MAVLAGEEAGGAAISQPVTGRWMQKARVSLKNLAGGAGGERRRLGVEGFGVHFGNCTLAGERLREERMPSCRHAARSSLHRQKEVLVTMLLHQVTKKLDQLLEGGLGPESRVEPSAFLAPATAQRVGQLAPHQPLAAGHVEPGKLGVVPQMGLSDQTQVPEVADVDAHVGAAANGREGLELLEDEEATLEADPKRSAS